MLQNRDLQYSSDVYPSPTAALSIPADCADLQFRNRRTRRPSKKRAILNQARNKRVVPCSFTGVCSFQRRLHPFKAVPSTVSCSILGAGHVLRTQLSPRIAAPLRPKERDCAANADQSLEACLPTLALDVSLDRRSEHCFDNVFWSVPQPSPIQEGVVPLPLPLSTAAVSKLTVLTV